MPEESWNGTRNTNNSGVTINNLGKTSYIMLAVFAGFGVGCGVWSLIDSNRTERETRLLEYYVMENDHKLVQHGLLKPEETWSAKKSQRETTK